MDDLSMSSNINEKWLNNVYENIKKMEEHERLSREGCESLFDFLRMSYEHRKVIIGSTQFKNLSFFITEFGLLLTDLSPVIKKDTLKKFKNTLDTIEKALGTKALFIDEHYDADGRITETSPTRFFWETIKALNNLKTDLFIEIKDILYIKTHEEGP